MKQLILWVLMLPCPFFLPAQPAPKPAYQITVTIKGYEGDTVFLGYRRADKVYSKDTVASNDGKFIFRGEEPVPPGVYLVLMPPDNKFFEFVVTKKEQHFSMETTAPEFFKNLKFRGAPDNQLLNGYQHFMNDRVEVAKKLQVEIDATADEKTKDQLKKQQEEIGKEVRSYQDKIVAEHPGTYTAKLIRAFQEPEVPEPPRKADGSIDSTFQWRYYRAHFLDGFDFSEEAFVNTPFLKEKVDRYLDKLTIQTPDSVIAAVDRILDRAAANQEVFRWTLPYLLNKYYTPEVMGLDAVYVHLSDKYYASGKADWVTEENLKKITDDAYMIRGVLLGSPAPEVRVQTYDPASHSFSNQLISLYDVTADYTVIFLWKPGCGHCKKVSDELKVFYEEWKNKGVEVFSITSANHTELDKALADVKEKNMPWIITADPYLRARALQRFYGISLPKLYLLDKNKKIIANRVGVPQLPQIIEDHRKRQMATDR
jgi:thiol-disulfide isomerase/thioredoxin